MTTKRPTEALYQKRGRRYVPVNSYRRLPRNGWRLI